MRILVLILLLAIAGITHGQSVTEEINNIIHRDDAEAHLSFLAADEMRGRDTGSPELQIAANYIRTQFKLNKVKPAPGTDNYFQYVDLLKSTPPAAGELMVNNTVFKLKESMVVIEGGASDWTGEFIYVGYGSQQDLEKKNIKGKMVLALAGSKDADNINKIFSISRDKFNTVKKMGGAGLIEFLALPQVPWPALVNFFNQEHWSIGSGELTQPFIWLKPGDLKSLNLKENQTIKGSLKLQADKPKTFKGKNVAGFIEGTDPSMKDQYVVMTAHYDHVGVQRQQDQQDSIFNGARDNATGTVALLQAARYFSKFPPKRSILFVAVTSEEKGLLGSAWYVKHPLVPLKNHVLNINCDGVGYNDKTRITSISLGRTNLDDLIVAAARDYGLTVGGDPDPREGFYERSDQVSFAKEGIPAVKLQPGLAQMDQSIWDYYHRPADEVSSLDLDYLTTFYRTFVNAVQAIVNNPRRPEWAKGDKFEAAGKALYGK